MIKTEGTFDFKKMQALAENLLHTYNVRAVINILKWDHKLSDHDACVVCREAAPLVAESQKNTFLRDVWDALDHRPVPVVKE